MRPRLVCLAALTVATAAQAAPAVDAAWSRPAAQGTTGVGYLTLVNPGGKPDALVAIKSPASRTVQIHQSAVSQGVASMRRVESVPIAPGGRVVFAPGGYHLMFLNLAKPQSAGDRIAATLIFARGARVPVTFVVGLAPPVEGGVHHH